MTRNREIWVQRVLDDWIPPMLRDARWFMWFPFKLLFRSRSREWMDFKGKAFALNRSEFRDVYQRLGGDAVGSSITDLNDACIERIEARVMGPRILEVGTGSGFLAHRLAKEHTVTAIDLVIDSALPGRGAQFCEGDIEALPFADRSFDTVICAHTLEHVQRLPEAIHELRRVTAGRLIIVVPRQRAYAYSFNLHIHFFPYEWSLLAFFGHRPGACIERLGDWYYQEDQLVGASPVTER